MQNITSQFVIRRALRLALLIPIGIWATACASWGNKETGGAIGATAGAAAGAAIGNNNGSTARGAILGAIIGGTAGAIIGHQMDQQAKELKDEIPGASVERVGEGIQLTFASGLLYDFDSDAVKASAQQNLRNLAESLRKYPETELLIVGHTDASGADDYNQLLSQRRAMAASNYLASLGINATRLHTAGRGEFEPIASNATEDGRTQNRRIEVAIYKGGVRP
jgi:outer membrane protein OmpA-like peptidoglycan-associated protein